MKREDVSDSSIPCLYMYLLPATFGSAGFAIFAVDYWLDFLLMETMQAYMHALMAIIGQWNHLIRNKPKTYNREMK